MIICKNCGNVHTEGIKFCPVCGSKFEESVAENGNLPYIKTDKPKKGSTGKVVGIIVACAVVLIGGFFVWAVLWGNEELKKNAVTAVTEEKEEKDETAETGETKVCDTLEFYRNLQEKGSYPYALNEQSEAFLQKHEDFFPVKNPAELTNVVDPELDYRHLNKSISKYGDKLFYQSSMYVLDIEEITMTEDTVLTTMQVFDEDGNSFIVLYRGELPDVFKEDTVSVYGLPLGLTSFDNIGGGTTLAVVLAGCSVEKGNTDDSECYASILQQVSEEQSEYEDDTYGLYDIDADGTMELLIAGDFTVDIYTIKDGEPFYLGQEDKRYGGFYKAEDGNGIYMVSEFANGEAVERITKQGDTIHLEEVWSIWTDCLNDYYRNDHPIMLYDISDHSGLENPPAADNRPVTVEESNCFLFPVSSSQYLTKADLVGLSAFECKIARNEIYARHGRLFTDAQLQNYFNQKSWYLGYYEPEEFDDTVLNEYERANLDLIVQYETNQGYR